jgi:protein tyrosine phosphatase (PTP) superfamily phosphohydrolase (DUF442 family)
MSTENHEGEGKSGGGAGRGGPARFAEDPLLALDPQAFEAGAKRDWLLARQRRIRRWRKPLTRRRDRIRAWLNMLIVDHGFIRYFYSNTWRVSPSMWRSAQPGPHHIRRFARAGGRTVVTLRGGVMFGSLPLEVEACDAAELDFRTIVLRSRALPTRAEMIEILDALGTLETPVLFHCKSGADRAGFMSALWLIAREGADLDTATRQLSLRYGHFRRSKTGVLDAFFEAYRHEGLADDLTLREWVETRYDPKAITKRFHAGGLGAFLGDRLLRRE